MGGVASGFLQAKIRSENAAAEAEKQRLANLEKEKDRQVRRDIAADQLEMNRLQLQQSRDSAEKRDSTAIANASFGLLKDMAKTNRGLIKLSDSFTSTQIEAMVDRGLIPRGDVYDGSAIFKHQQELTQQKLIEKQLQNYGKYDTHPDAILLPVYEQVADRINAKRMGEQADAPGLPSGAITAAQAEVNYRRGFEKKQYAGMYNLFKEVHPNREAYHHTNAAGQTTLKPMPHTGIEAMTNSPTLTAFKGLENAPTEIQFQVQSNPDNITPIKFSELESAEHELKLLQDGSSEKQGLIKKIKTTYASKFNDVNKTFTRNNGRIKAIDAQGNQAITAYKDSFEKLFPELFKVFKNTVDVKTGVVPTQPKTIEEKAKQDVKDGVAQNVNEAIAMRQNNLIEENSVDIILSGQGAVLGSPIRKAGEEPKRVPEVKIVKNQPIEKTVPSTNTARLTPQPRKYKTPDGNEKFVINFQDSNLNTGELDTLLSYNEIIKTDPAYFEKNPNEKEKYDRLKGIFKPLSAVIDNPDSEQARANLKAKVVELFDIRRVDGRVDPKALDTAVNKLVQEEYFDRGSKSPTFSSINGVTVMTTYTMPGESEDNYKKPKQKLRDEEKKLDQVTDMTASYSNNIDNIALISEILDRGEFTNEHARIFNAMMQGVDVKNDLRELLKMSTEEMTVKGYKVATDASTNTVRVIERFKDFFTAFQVAAQNLGSTVNGVRVRDSDGRDIILKANNFKSQGSDSINDRNTQLKLQEVEDAARVYSEKYSTNIQNALQKAQVAKQNDNTREYFKQKMIAFRNNLLARNAMQKVTLTYTFAGMVQGESGGRAISNEDFAILYQAIWSKTGNDMGRGSFTELQNVIKGIKERNSMMQKYIELKDGPEIANFMVRLNRGLAKDNLKELYLNAANFKLSDRLPELKESLPESSNYIEIPPNLITNIYVGNDSANSSPVVGLNAISKEQRGKIFTKDVVNPILNSMPTPVLEKSRPLAGNRNLRVSKFKDLDADVKNNITQNAIKSLISSIYRNEITPQGTVSPTRSLSSDAVSLMNMYSNIDGNRELKLGDALVNIQQLRDALKVSDDVAANIESKGDAGVAFIQNLVEHIYDKTSQKRYDESNPTKGL